MIRKALVIIAASLIMGGLMQTDGGRVLDNVAVVSCIVFDTDEQGDMLLYFVATDSTKPPKESVGKYALVEGKGKNVAECIDSAQRAVGKTVFLGHTRMGIMERSFCERAEYVRDYYDFAKRDSYYNICANLYVLDDEHKRFVEFIENDEIPKTLFFDNSLKKQPINEYYTKSLNEVLSEGGTSNLPYLSAEDKLKINGFCVMKNDALKAVYTPEQSVLMRLLRGAEHKLLLSLPSGIFIADERLKVSCDDNMCITYDIKLTLEVVSLKGAEILKTREELVELGKRASLELQNKAEEFCKEFTEDEADVLGEKLYLFRYHPRLYRKCVSSGWNITKLVRRKIHVTADVIRNGVLY